MQYFKDNIDNLNTIDTEAKANKWNIALPLLGIILLFIGFLFSRVVSNIGFLLIGIYVIFHIRKISWLFYNKWMFTFLGLALLPLLSDIIYEGTGFLQHRGVMKCLLILFPAFIFAFNPKKNLISAIHYLIIFVMTISTAYSLQNYIFDYENITSQYNVSKVMSVLSFGDHIRVSWVVVISCLLALYQYKSTTSKYIKLLLVSYIIIQIVYLHILGSKTGLIALYLSAIISLAFEFGRLKNWLFVLFAAVIFLLPVIAYNTIPTFAQRVNYIKYDYGHYSKGEFKDGLSDAVRFNSLKAGKDIIISNPITGVGFSNLQEETESWYKQNLPELSPKSYFLPSSEIIIYWASGGIVAFLLFLSHMFIPFTMPYLRKNIWFMAFFIPAIFSFTFETHLEGQLPIFVYGFFVAWFWWLAWRERQALGT